MHGHLLAQLTRSTCEGPAVRDRRLTTNSLTFKRSPKHRPGPYRHHITRLSPRRPSPPAASARSPSQPQSLPLASSHLCSPCLIGILARANRFHHRSSSPQRSSIRYGTHRTLHTHRTPRTLAPHRTHFTPLSRSPYPLPVESSKRRPTPRLDSVHYSTIVALSNQVAGAGGS